jgi:hypothetical protein
MLLARLIKILIRIIQLQYVFISLAIAKAINFFGTVFQKTEVLRLEDGLLELKMY